MPTTQQNQGIPVRQWFNIAVWILATVVGLVAQSAYGEWYGFKFFVATILIYGAVTVRRIPAMPRQMGFVIFLDRFQGNDVLKRSGWYFGFVPGFVKLERRELRFEIRFTISTTTPDGGPIEIKDGNIVAEINSDDIGNFIAWGDITGISDNLRRVAEEASRHWAHSEGEGPYDYREARDHDHEVWNAILRELGCLAPIPSAVPTPVLMRYFAGRKPSKIDVAEGRWTNADTEWEGIRDCLEGMSPAYLTALELAVKSRRRLISEFRTGGLPGGIVVPDRGCRLILITLSVDTTEEGQKQERDIFNAEIADRRRQIELATKQRELKAYAEIIPPAKVAEFYLVETDKAKMNIEKKDYELHGEGGGAAVVISALEGAAQRFFGGGRKKGRKTE